MHRFVRRGITDGKDGHSDIMNATTSHIIIESNYLSSPRLAEQLGRHRVSIYRFIKRRQIIAAFTLNGFHCNDGATLAKVAKGMRCGNGCNGNGSRQ